MIIQIYEIQSEAEAKLALKSGVDHIGSVILSETHWKDSSVRSAIDLVHQNGKKCTLIPLFSEITTIHRCIEYYHPDIIHFCESIPFGNDQKEHLDRLITIQKMVRQRFPNIQMMRSIPIGEPGTGQANLSFELAECFEPYSDFFLTDTIISANDQACAADQPVNGFVGITGRICDWQIAAALVERCHIPVILAGGLGPDNVMDAISTVAPYGVDSCTGTNAQDVDGHPIRFQKDPEKLRRFISNARIAETTLPPKR